jgi:hypothetical protein
MIIDTDSFVADVPISSKEWLDASRPAILFHASE